MTEEKNIEKIKVLTPVVTKEGWSIGIAVWGEQGYRTTDLVFETEEIVKQFCDEYNERHGFNKRQAWLIVTKTMFPGCTATLEDVVLAGKEKQKRPL